MYSSNATGDNAGGAGVACPSTAVLTITDNDTAQPTTNPIDDAPFFVRQHYADFLNRPADDLGLDQRQLDFPAHDN